MKKISVLLAVLSLLIVTSFLPVFAGPETTQTCPVSGDALKNNSFALDYQEKTYHFCCKGCMRKFKKNPSQYIVEPS